jgi:hypothetical protein
MRWFIVIWFITFVIIYLVATVGLVMIVNKLTPDNLWIRVPCWGLLGALHGLIIAIAGDVGRKMNKEMN